VAHEARATGLVTSTDTAEPVSASEPVDAEAAELDAAIDA
jgi:hypothetical protein